MKEIWKDIPGYEGMYRASNLGKILSVKSKGRVLSPSIDRYGYYHLNLYKDGRARSQRVHRLIAITFIDNPNEYSYVNHKDENKRNNRVDNLEWCTMEYNLRFGTRICRSAKGHSKRVIGESIKKQSTIEFESTNDAQRHGFYSGGVSRCCNGKIKSYKGYKWRYT